MTALYLIAALAAALAALFYATAKLVDALADFRRGELVERVLRDDSLDEPAPAPSSTFTFSPGSLDFAAGIPSGVHVDSPYVSNDPTAPIARRHLELVDDEPAV